MPCHIKVLSFSLEKDSCHCANNKYQVTVYTEHLQTRLADFQLAGGMNKETVRNSQFSSEMNSKMVNGEKREMLNSFSLS